ncbi:MAG TPA: PrsW family glutamic-type intramembrane protease [Streptosporangiaceae bacterium]|nr:PrsW family glutamic-type intramembrane protease [Streptosporangiaceae bacterium]
MPVRHWLRDPALRSWPVLLLVALVSVPPLGLVLLNNATEAKIRDIAWIFAAYFAVAWLLLLGVIVRPQHVSRAMLATVAVVGVVTQAPIAIWLETELHAGTSSLLDIFTIGVPEELAKAIPIVVVAWIWRRFWHTQTPRDYLFLGAVSGLVFGAAEVVHYFSDVLGHLSGNATGPDLQALTLEYVWRFLTDPIDHACWAGITGYFIGLAITGQSRKYAVAPVGIGIAAILHGLNDWNPVNSHIAWVLVTLISVLLFLAYARAGAWLPPQAVGVPEQASPYGYTAPWPVGHPAQQSGPQGVPAAPAAPAPPAAATSGPPGAPEVWWQPAASGRPAESHPPRSAQSSAGAAAGPQDRVAPHAAASQNSATLPTTQVERRPRPKPWWEQ